MHRWRRRLPLAWLGLCLAWAGFTFTAASEPARPNVLFLFTDDQRADTITALGNRHVRTPNLDRLVSRGTSFTQAYIMGGSQPAVCMPSRAMLMTSLSLPRIHDKLEGQTTWPEQFSKANYRTFLVGKWHNGAPAAQRCFDEGKNVFLGGMADPNNLPVCDFKRGESKLVKHVASKHETELFGDTALEFLRRQNDGHPFLCYVAFKAPHDPRTPPEKWRGAFRDPSPPVPPNFLPQHSFDNGEMTVRDEQLLAWPRTREAVSRELADYYDCIAAVDEQVGRLLDELRRLGLETNTLVVFASDNGLALGSHGLLGKQNLYEHSVRVPLILAGPGVPKGKRSEALCYLQDVFPTLAELAGVAPLAGRDGRSLLPLMQNPRAGFRDSIFTSYRDFQRAIRDERYKLIRYPQINKTQLFDLRRDPQELQDLSGEPRHAKTVARLTDRLREAQREFGDSLPLQVDQPKEAAWSPPAARTP